MLQALQVRSEYIMGPGDQLRITVIGEDQISNLYTIGPDGKLAVPMAGVLKFAGLTREQATDDLAKALAKKLPNASIAINVLQYNNNHVYVLGHVMHPGQIELSGEGRLLQALSSANVQVSDRSNTQLPLLPERCAIFRGGGQQVVWVDLRRLLNGADVSLNIPLRNNDLIYLPDIQEQFVYVMGAVGRSGAVPFRPKMTLLDALSGAGGITTDGRYNDVIVSRRIGETGDYGPPQEFDVRRVMEKGQGATPSIELSPGDVVFVRRSNMAKVGLFFQRIGPGIQMMNVGSNLFDTFYRSNSGGEVRRTTPAP
jgi:polysaccharide export outer membrane protein